MIRKGQTPIIGNLRSIPLVRLVPDLGDQVVVERQLIVSGYDEVRVDVPDLCDDDDDM
jgi:hypothetical protein